MIAINSLLISKEDFINCEKLRIDVFHVQNSDKYKYLKDLESKELYAYGTKIDDILIAGCYFSVGYNVLNIQKLFVKEEYQNTGARYGRNLLLNILANKKYIEELTGKNIDESWIYPINDKSLSLYKKIGYENIGGDFSIMHKKI